MTQPGQAADENDSDGVTDRHVYNVVSDTVVGANIRWKDNLFQGVAILVCVILGAIIGTFSFEDRLPGAVGGSFIGLVVGLLGSGTFLMAFRAVMHLRGRHD